MAGNGAGTALGEFALIARYLTRPSGERQGIGDDCALIDVGDQTLAITTDLLVEGVHFLPGADPASLGHKALAVNLSDLAAAGARPRCFVLGVALPPTEGPWLEAFCGGLFALAQRHGCALVGGDTTRAAPAGAAAGRLTISITALGAVDALRDCGRSGARAGDDIWVSGSLGEAALALVLRRGELTIEAHAREQCLLRLDRPEPRVELGLALAGLASATIDVSDGLCGDLRHILERSAVGARIDWSCVPRAAVFDTLPVPMQQRCVLAGGDDYELLFTARPAHRGAIDALGTPALPVTRIGQVESAAGLRLRNVDGTVVETTLAGYDHFA